MTFSLNYALKSWGRRPREGGRGRGERGKENKR